MWNGKDTDPMLTTCQCEDEDATRILFEIPQYKFPITFTAPPQTIQRGSMTSIRISMDGSIPE